MHMLCFQFRASIEDIVKPSQDDYDLVRWIRGKHISAEIPHHILPIESQPLSDGHSVTYSAVVSI